MREARKTEVIPVGISACLLGQKVRYNGADKYDEFIVENLGPYFKWISICPELEAGLGVPRESMRLVQKAGKTHLLTVQTEKDLTDRLRRFSKARVKDLSKLGLRGFLLKKNSPSCGMDRVKVYRTSGIPYPDGRGLFAQALLDAFPNLPVEEEGRLINPRLRENWITRVFAYHDLKKLFESKWELGDLINFHTRYKMVLLAHDEISYRRLGQTVAHAKQKSKSEFAAEYEHDFMATLKKLATPKKHANVLEHMMGHLKKMLSPNEKREILETITDYRKGIFPLSVPVVLLKHFIDKHEISYLMNQAYLRPHPKELALRNFK